METSQDGGQTRWRLDKNHKMEARQESQDGASSINSLGFIAFEVNTNLTKKKIFFKMGLFSLIEKKFFFKMGLFRLIEKKFENPLGLFRLIEKNLKSFDLILKKYFKMFSFMI